MEFTGLFSHPDEPEVAAKTDRDSEPVQAPTFSDRPKGNSTAATSQS
jgi:hypothetical protein